jgi:hypothetical protein
MRFLPKVLAGILLNILVLSPLMTLAEQGIVASEKVLDYRDRIFEKNIRTVLLFPADRMAEAAVVPVVMPIAQQIPFLLKFDEIYADQSDLYMVRILHCTAGWKPSGLSELEYMHDFNEFAINDFEFSGTPRVPYVHYTFEVPRVRLPGNYLLVVYRNYDKDDLVLTRRFMIATQQIRVHPELAMSTGVSQRFENHQINFTLDYSNLPVVNPLLDLRVVIRQNQRWDNAVEDLKPTMVREDLGQLVYRHAGLENNFKAGNEFRFFDLRSIRYSGQNIERINSGPNSHDAFLYIDLPRQGQAYAITRDLNGGFLIQNRDLPGNDTEADYVRVHFFLKLEEDPQTPVYIGGKLTGWTYSEENRMVYMPASGLFAASLLLKQGLYDYQYCLPDNHDNFNGLEGNHFETRNEYEILVYLRNPMNQADLLVGYEYLAGN